MVVGGLVLTEEGPGSREEPLPPRSLERPALGSGDLDWDFLEPEPGD